MALECGVSDSSYSLIPEIFASSSAETNEAESALRRRVFVLHCYSSNCLFFSQSLDKGRLPTIYYLIIIVLSFSKKQKNCPDKLNEITVLPRRNSTHADDACIIKKYAPSDDGTKQKRRLPGYSTRMHTPRRYQFPPAPA